ncbi:VanZ family protein [Gordonibacter sp. 28C]|uniref:VanZ family protein n=1 Tax=Gordonibacter sp. 28C TaxID=2078569 RepID=UPI001313F674|nr:VanZ family protein [Gordonibacter sp. 28C]
MEEMALAVYELAVASASTLVAFVLVRMHARRTGKSAARLAPVLLLALYLFGVVFVTGPLTVYDLTRHGFEVNPRQLNPVPFFTLAQAVDVGDALLGFGLNIALFVPLGLLLPFVWPRVGRMLPVVTFGLGLSLLIELSQLFNNRTTDVDDLVANTLGTLVGFAVYALWRDAVDRPRAVRGKHGVFGQPALSGITMPQTKDAPAFANAPCAWRALGEPAFYALALLAGHFLLYNELGLAKLLYGF